MKSKLSALLVIALLACSCVALGLRTVTFHGTSMLPTIKDGDKLKVVRLDGKSRRLLVRGDIVVFRYPLDPSKSYIKRLIGLPGEQIEIKSGEVWIDGSKLSEPYISSKLNVFPKSQAPVRVPVDAYYFMGDNRDNSSDSRIWGSVPEDLIDAKVVRQ